VPEFFDIKSAQLPAMALLLKSEDPKQVAKELLSNFGKASDNGNFFDDDAMVIDDTKVVGIFPAEGLVTLMTALRECRLRPVAVRSNHAAFCDQARSLGLVVAEEVIQKRSDESQKSASNQETPVVREVVKEVVRERPVPATMLVDKPVRSGQKIYARGGDLVVLAAVNQGAEVIADGNVHVYAPLRGKAMAGASGNVQARVFSTCLEPELISIAGVYRTSENALPKHIHGKAVQVRLISQDGKEKLMFEPLVS